MSTVAHSRCSHLREVGRGSGHWHTVMCRNHGGWSNQWQTIKYLPGRCEVVWPLAHSRCSCPEEVGASSHWHK